MIPNLNNTLNYTMEHLTSALSLPKTMGSKSFTKFSALPPELRIKIWQHAMPDARTIVVKSPFARQSEPPRSLDDAFSRPEDEQVKTWYSNTQIPTLLHVNGEARHEGLKHYSLSLAVGDSLPRVYVDFTRDTLFFGDAELKPECSTLWASTKDMDKVQRLAVVPEGAYRILRWKSMDLTAIEKMVFVHDTEKLQLGSTPELVEDVPQEEEVEEPVEAVLSIAEDAETGEPSETKAATPTDPMKKRMQEALEELDTLMTVLPTQWEKPPAVATAVFRSSMSCALAC